MSRRPPAVAASSPAEAAKDADVVIAILSDDAAARAVWLDPNLSACAALRPGAIAMESSTATPDGIAELGAKVAARGAALVDAPVAGSLPHAEAGQPVFLIGGEADAVTAARPTLASLGAARHHLGPSGRGARFKLAVNLLLGAQVACVAEVLGGLGGRLRRREHHRRAKTISMRRRPHQFAAALGSRIATARKS